MADRERVRARWKQVVGIAIVAFLIYAALPPSIDPVGERAGEPVARLPDDEPVHHLLLIGDTGKPEAGGEPVLSMLRQRALELGEQSTTVFLGDNLYQYGLPDPSDPSYPEARRRIVQQLDSLKGYQGRLRFIPGNHDWGHGVPGGSTRAKRQAALVDSTFPGAFPVRPEAPPIHLDTLAQDVVLVSLDTAWWLYEDARPSPERSDSLAAFTSAFADVMQALSDQVVVVASHHPMVTNGPHGGHFPLRSHVYPLTEVEPWAYVPLPGLGSLALAWYNRWGQTIQDLGHPRYRALAGVMLGPTQRHARTIYATGHEHALQHFDRSGEDGTHYVVSGSGCAAKQDAITAGNGLDWGVSQTGIAHVRFFSDGSAWLDFVTPGVEQSETRATGVVRYRARLF